MKRAKIMKKKLNKYFYVFPLRLRGNLIMEILEEIIASLAPKKTVKDPYDFTDPVYDAEVKKAVKVIGEAKALGWKSATLLAPSEEIADRLESLIRVTNQFTCTRNKLYFELSWTNALPVEQIVEQAPAPEELTQEEIEMLSMMMQDIDFWQ